MFSTKISTLADLTKILSDLVIVGTAGAALWWFWFGENYKRRIQFDLNCCCFAIAPNIDWMIAKIQFVFENKGFVEHKLYDLTLSVHTLDIEAAPTTTYAPTTKHETEEVVFDKRLLKKRFL